MSFQIYPLSRFEQKGQTSIRRPKEFLYFSFDDQHDLKVLSNESLRYYYPPFIEAPGVSVSKEGHDCWALMARASFSSTTPTVLMAFMFA